MTILFAVIDTAVICVVPCLCLLLPVPFGIIAALTVMFTAFLFVNIVPDVLTNARIRLKVLNGAGTLLIAFLISAAVLTAILVYRIATGIFTPETDIAYIVFAVLCDFIVLANGLVRIYATSVQAGIKLRVLTAVFAFIPVINAIFLIKLIITAKREAAFEKDYDAREKVFAENKVCATRYPIMMVHGVFFRDSRLLNYWGRIPPALERCGAVIRYGGQQSALSVEQSANELAARIEQTCKELGCEKLNVIAHSKGGLDTRYAISKLGCGKYIASLTTICTPHHGCIFVENIYNRIPEAGRLKMAAAYNAAARRAGDTAPDFLAAVGDLRESVSIARDAEMPDDPDVYYQSVGAAAKDRHSGRFPLNISLPLVNKTDGENDGLVSVVSSMHGAKHTTMRVPGHRGITHADMIDLNRENVKDFDVRTFYIELVNELRESGF